MKKLVLLLLLTLTPLLAKSQINASGVIIMGRNALYYEDYVLAIQYFNQVIEAKSYLYEPYYYRAIAKYYLGDYQGAASDCSLSIDRDPFIDNCFKLRAISLVMMGEYKKASEDYETLIKRQDDDRDLWYNLVLCKSQLKEFDSADSLLDTMIVKWPANARQYMLKAQIALEKKDTVQAASLIDQTLQIDSFDVDALSGKAMLCMHTDSFVQAEQYYEKAIIQSPRKASYFLGRALARYQQKKLRGSMDDYNVALDLDPDNYPGHYNRGLLRMQVGENNLAIEDFNFVLAKESHDRLALYNRALLLEKTGNYKGAIEDYNVVLEDYPEFLAGYENRGRCYRKIADNANAVKDERKVLEAKLDQMYGNPKKKKRIVRKQKEQDINEYQNLVIEDESDNLAQFYSKDYRGKVQNREVSGEPAPLYVLTFNAQTDDVIKRKNYIPFIEEFNEAQLFSHPIYVSSRYASLNEDDIATLDATGQTIVNKIGNTKATTKQLLALAIISYFKHDDASAISSLDQILRQDSTYKAALYLRALVQVSGAFQNEDANKSTNLKQKDETKENNLIFSIQSNQIYAAISDFTRAIKVESNCSYLYYDRGCLYQDLHDLDKAIEDFTTAINLHSSLAEAYYNRGLCYVEKKDFTNAFADLGKAGELGLYSAYSLIKHFRKLQQENNKTKR